MANKIEEIVKLVEELTVLELSELIKAIEEKFGVSAMSMMAGPMMAATPVGDEEGGKTEEKTAFSVVLKSAGGSKVPVIKVVKEITGLGLKEAKDLVDAAPKAIKEGVKKEEAEEMKKKLEEVGATAEIA